MANDKCPKCGAENCEGCYGCLSYISTKDIFMQSNQCLRNQLTQANAKIGSLQAIVDKLPPRHELPRQPELFDALLWFVGEMGKKLNQKEIKGWLGWNFDYFIEDKRCCFRKLKSHVDRLLKGDINQAVDVANFCMFVAHYYSTKEAAACHADLSGEAPAKTEAAQAAMKGETG